MREKDYYGAIKGFCTKWGLPEVWNSDRITNPNLINEVIKVLNAMIRELREYEDRVDGKLEEMLKMIDDFLKMFNEDLSDTVLTILLEWKESGELGEIINEALFNQKLDKVEFENFKSFVLKNYSLYFDTVVEIESSDLILGNIVHTKGYNFINDGGGETYLVSDSGSEDKGSVIKVDNFYLHHLVTKTTMNFESWGIVENGNIVNRLNDALEYCSNKGLNLIINKDYDISVKEPIEKANGIYLPSNSHLTINSTLKVEGDILSDLRTFTGEVLTPEYTSSNNVIIDGKGTLDMNFREGCGIRLGHAKNVTIKDISILNINRDHAIEVGGSKNVMIDGLRFNGMINAPESEKYGETIQLEDSGIGAGGADPQDGTPPYNVTIQNCIFEGDGIANNHVAIGSHSELRGKTTYDNIKILNNTFIGVNKAVIVPNDWKNVVISGNTVKNCKHAFIGRINYKANSIENGVISNNVIVDNGSYETNIVSDSLIEYIFVIYVAKNVVISNNSVNKTTMGVINIVSSQDILIEGNNFNEYALKNNESTYDFVQAVNIEHYSDVPSCRNITIKNNVFTTTAKNHHRVMKISESTDLNSFIITDNVYNITEGIDAHTSRQLVGTRQDVLFSGEKWYGDVPILRNLYNYDMVYVVVKTGGYSVMHPVTLKSSGQTDWHFTDFVPAASQPYIRFQKIEFKIENGGSTCRIHHNSNTQGTLGTSGSFEISVANESTSSTTMSRIIRIIGVSEDKHIW